MHIIQLLILIFRHYHFQLLTFELFLLDILYRETTLANADEAGDIIAVYNPNNSVGFKWTVSQVRTSGGAQISFNMTDNGQIQFSTTALSGASHSGKITFEARALEQT